MMPTKFISLLIFVLLVTPFNVFAEIDDENLPRGAQLLGVARSDGVDPSFDKRLKGELDKLLPKLKELTSDATILIEVFFPDKKGNNKEQQLNMAFSLAEQVQQYLKVEQSLDRDYFVSIWKSVKEKSNYPKIRITTYPREYFGN